ncbi:vacuolar protein sorting-associated protein 13 [Obba rivulosa]|uniref:Vacuolar protein sorting-associated protein 13 n=1 Tax=Obba rivulosa TaxID=1052685 RepID=A0A8E2DUQ1_9APHY|nr:vacuolar protein sorting-associated protein 13 [Obba rivulosa]
MVWWTDPGKEVLNILFNRVLAPYVENLDMNQVNYGIGQGRLTLTKLRLKKGALDKFRLPVDVVEGHLGKFTLSLHWLNLGSQPVEVFIEDVYLLVVPSSETTYDPEEDERRQQAAKMERLQNAELLHLQGSEVSQDSPQSQGLLASLTAKIINNLQITVRNIHVRYEDKLSVPGHPFAAGLTLAGFTAVSVNDKWETAFIDSSAGAIHKLSKLESLALYFDTDSDSLSGLSYEELVKKFTALIPRNGNLPDHQFILKPVTGEGRIIMNHQPDKEIPRFDVQLFFDEIGVILDDNQYRDAISLLDMYHFYMRQHQYQKYRPSAEELKANRPRALLRFAGRAILDEVRERRRKWTWAYFAERRNDRHRYVELFKKKQLGSLSDGEASEFDALERKLSYEDIRFYRSIARSQLKKDLAARRRVEEENKKQHPQQQSSWTSWLWGSSDTTQSTNQDPVFPGELTDDQRKELYDVLDYDEKTALADSFETPRDALKARVAAQLKRGSFALRTDPRGRRQDIVSMVFDVFQATFIQRSDNFETSMSLGGFAVHDGTTSNTLYPLVVHVQESRNKDGIVKALPIGKDEPVHPAHDPFFYLRFENNPLDGRADSALTFRMRYMEIVYHRGYIEAIYKFFKPPASQLESVEALLSAASETLEGLRKETRAGLEYALQTHKTIDVHMDFNAPIIIIPEDITTENCRHLVIDAGHIAIKSELVNKQAMQEIQAKRKQEYTDEDYKRLESMMYDRLLVRLEAAQFLLGNNLKSCMDALTSSEPDNLHLLERINLDLQVQNSIVPTAYNLARFKISAHLPALQVNLSDSKYKSLMRLIDVCLPHFDEDDSAAYSSDHIQRPSTFRLPSGIFGPGKEYNVDDDDDDERREVSSPKDNHDEEFFEAEEGELQGDPATRQHMVELNFTVDTLRASLSKSIGKDDRPLGDVVFDRFALAFAMAKYVMAVDVNLSSVSMHVMQDGREPIEFMSSAEANTDEDLLTVRYTRVQQASPEYLTVYEGVDQNVDVKISTFLFRAAPEPVLTLYDFIMTTFVPQQSEKAIATPQNILPNANGETGSQGSEIRMEKIRVLLKLASIQVILMNNDARLATLSLSTADVSIILRSSTMRVSGRLGSLDLVDNSQLPTAGPAFKQMLSIEGDNFADFQYQTYDPHDKESYKGVKSSITLNAASLKIHYLEQPLRDIYVFVTKLAKLKGLYDAATEAAVQRASEIERMVFDISIKSPILIFPSDAQQSQDMLTLRLGEFSAKNSYEDSANHTTASLRGIQLASQLYHDGQLSFLKMVDDIDATAKIVQPNSIDRAKDTTSPDTQINVAISDVRLHLTQIQYSLLIALSVSIPRVLAGAPVGLSEVGEQSTGAVSNREPSRDLVEPDEPTSEVDMQPELRPVPSTEASIWTSIDALVTISAVKLHLYDKSAFTDTDLNNHGIARFALNSNSLRAKVLSNGAMEAQVIFKSMTMSNTRPGSSKFREIIPASKHDRNQVMLLYSVSGGAERSSLAVVTVDSPQVIFAVDPVIALLDFFTSGLPPSNASDSETADETTMMNDQSSPFAFRLDLHDISISVLENDMDPESQAIRLSIEQISLSQQATLTLSVARLGMSLVRMGGSPESVRFLDDVDVTLSLDNRATEAHKSTDIEISMQPVVFRASYRDINLITSIINKAIELYSSSLESNRENSEAVVQQSSKTSSRRPRTSQRLTHTLSKAQPLGNAHVLVSKEQLRASFDGLRLVLIGDLHEQPLLHFKVKPFSAEAQDWSSGLLATSSMTTQITYWNLSNSHWEPLIDPWTFTVIVSKPSPTSGLSLTLSAQERLDVNLTTIFVESALATARMLGKEGDYVLRKARGSYAPYRIRNRTGSTIYVWPDIEGSNNARETAAVQIPHDKTIDWRFDDWKTMREHVSSSGHNSIGLQIIGKPWEQIRSIPVDREGEFTFTLRPRSEKYAHRLLCEVKVQDNVKFVTLRSTYKVENQTLYPLELTLVDVSGQPIQAVEKISPGHDYALPIEAVGQYRVKLQPDQGFGYRWSPAIRWEELVAKRRFTIKCPHTDQNEAAFRFQAWVETDVGDVSTGKYPKISLKLRAPIELENLLPYNIKYRIYDKNSDQNWRSYLRQGGIMPVHSVELGHLVLLNIHIEDSVFKPSDFAIISTDANSDFDVESSLILRDAADRKLELKLNYVRKPNSGGSFKVQIYCPFLLVNKTGLPFSVRPSRSTRIGTPSDVAGDMRPDVLSSRKPFMLSHSDRGNSFNFKVGESMWSQDVSFEAPAADTRLAMPSQARRTEEIQIGLSWSEGLGKYKLTKVITLAPRFIVKNDFSEPITFREHGVAPKGRSTLNPRDRCPLHFIKSGEEKLLTFAFPGLNAQWSTPINIEDIGSVHFRLHSSGEPITTHLVRADVKLNGSTIFVSLSDPKEGWPFTIENDSDYSFTFYQADQSHPEVQAPGKSLPVYSVPKKSSVDYAWDYPAARDKRIVLAVNGSRRAIDIMEIGDLVPFKFSDQQGLRVVSLDVRAEAHKQILRITNYNPEHSLYKPRNRSSASLARRDSINSSQDAFEVVQEDVPPTLIVSLTLEGIGISLINRKLVEVVYLSANGLKLEYSSSPLSQAVELTCGSLQIDNQLHDALFPVVLQPSPLPADSASVASLPTVQASVIWLTDQAHGVFFVKYCSILLQALTIEADEDFLFSVYDLTKIKGASWDEEQEDILVQEPDDIPEPQDTVSGRDVYFEVLELQPIRLSISFMRTERISSEDKLSIRNPFAVVINAITMAVGNINDAPLEMNALAIKDMRLTLPDLQDRIMHHYRQEVLRQLYRILGSADFIGNPVGLFTNVSSGVADIFYEPFNGVVMHGNRDIGVGIAKGAASFVKKTVFGFSDSVTKFTSSVGKGLSATTFDAEYQLRRRMNQRRNKPRHAIYGVTAGAEAFASSVVSGVEGVVMKPLEGAESEGAKGFFKGVGKGLIGAVTKPVVGVFDLASNLSEGIRNTTTVFDNPARDRVRPPRLIPSDGVLVPYSEREALGQYWMKDLEQGRYRDEQYVAHINLPEGDNVILLTTSKVLSFWSNKLRLEWELPFTQVQGVTIEDTGIKFAHKMGKEHDKFVYIPDKASQSWFFSQIASVVKAYNARRRMD